jgi:4-hydroxy-tetrahydrodipicolinate synthase
MQGVIAAVPTPVTEGGTPIKALFQEHCQWALAHGCDGLNILGSTGEATSFDSAQRAEVMGWAIEACPKTRLMVGTGTPSLSDTIALTTRADDLGYGVALVLPPFYYKPISDAGLIAYYSALHKALGDRRIQIYFYNFPQMTGLTIPVEVISELASRFPTRFTGIKDSSGDLDYARAIVGLGQGLRVFPSSETVLSHARADGFAGCISASVNITAPLCARVWATESDAPEELVTEIARQRGVLAGPDLIPSIKHLVGKRSGDPAWRALVPPFLPLSAERAAQLEANIA